MKVTIVRKVVRVDFQCVDIPDLQKFMQENYPRKRHNWEDLDLAKRCFKKWVGGEFLERLIEDNWRYGKDCDPEEETWFEFD